MEGRETTITHERSSRRPRITRFLDAAPVAPVRVVTMRFEPVFGHDRIFVAISNHYRAARLQKYRRDSNKQENGPFKTGTKSRVAGSNRGPAIHDTTHSAPGFS